MSLSTLDQRTALIILDLQHVVMGIDTQPHSPATVLKRSSALADTFRAHSLPVVLVRTTGAPSGRTDQTQTSATSRDSMAQSADWATLHPTLTDSEHHLITKQAWGAFTGTGLDDHLRSLGATQVVLTGIATSLAVESTARMAHELGYHVTLVTDAMADRDAAVHHHSITKIFPRLGETGTTDELIRLVELVQPSVHDIKDS